jgi:class 3 adenylate cyclase
MTPAAERANAAIARGDLIAAYDETVSAIGEGDDSTVIRHQQVLALARMGDTDRAMELFEAYGLDRSDDPHQLAIGARLLKDRALAMPSGPGRDASLRAASDAYLSIYSDTGDSYPGINAASLARLCGETAKAQQLAADILAQPEVAEPSDYYMAATRAEALLLLGKSDESARCLRSAADMTGNTDGARSTTCRQLGLLARQMGLDEAAAEGLLSTVRPARVMHFCGHIFASDDTAETAIGKAIVDRLEEADIGFAYGALAAGADILIAEAVLARGAELHVILPFAKEDFVEQSVRPAGEGWVARFERCLAGATSRTFATEMAYVGDPQQFAYATRVAMGLATLRAQHLGNRPLQLAVWDGRETAGSAGTGADVAAWREHGGRSLIIDPGPVNRDLRRPPAREAASDERALAAIIFTDFPGFSKLAEEVLPRFWNGVMRGVAEVLDEHADQVLTRNSWGDALYAVVTSAGSAAEITLELQHRLRDFEYDSLGLEHGNGMRIGAHFGPAYRMVDHITGQLNFYGTEVSRAARIEPVTPPGAVFVTEPFAAILALESADRFQCRYVGRIELAKGYGKYPMYRLARLP